jgi:hypothetical protein
MSKEIARIFLWWVQNSIDESKEDAISSLKIALLHIDEAKR